MTEIRDCEEIKNILRNCLNQLIGQSCRRENKVQGILPAVKELRPLTGLVLFKLL